MRKSSLLPAISTTLCLACLPVTISATSVGPMPYLSFADSPFAGGSFSYFHLETFESGAVATPGVTLSAGVTVLGPGPLTDSVDADDGTIDGSGANGHSLLNSTSTRITFTFDSAVLGGLPTHVGIVWTDVGNSVPLTGVDNVQVEAFDPLGNSLGTSGSFTFGDGTAVSATAEDRFLGWSDLGGISKFTISTAQSTDWEVDHLQYGRVATQSVPEGGPGVAGLAAFALLIVPRLLLRPTR